MTDTPEKHEDQEDVVDLEEFAKAGKKVPKGKTYRIKIDKQKYDVNVPEMKALDILLLAGMEPVDQFALYQKPKGSKPVKLDINDTVDFTTPGIERFTTLPLDQREGEAYRMNFHMPEADMEFLKSLGKPFELVTVDDIQCVIIYGVELPDGYSVKTADVHFRIGTGYPDQEIDMAYFHPALSRSDGKSINALSMQSLDGKSWQRWSRHRTAENPWRPGLDNLETHFVFTMEWLICELK